MLDTNICIALIKGVNNVVERFKQNRRFGVCISSIVLAELQFGVYKSKNVKHNGENLLNFLLGMPVLPFDLSQTMDYGIVRAFLELNGMPVGPLDTLIAAHARSLSLIMVTNNTREFSRIPDLRIENWMT
jgi:tRNA(fMet)-specific endonuclease VapC